MSMATLPWNPILSSKPQTLNISSVRSLSYRHALSVHAFRRSDFEEFSSRLSSGDLWRDAWRRANDGFELFVYETKKTAERIDRRYSVSTRLSAAAESAFYRAKELDRDFELTQRWRNLTLDFSRNWPRYRKQLNGFLGTPLGRGFVTIFFLWFALSGWMFQFFIFAIWVLPFAAPLLISTVAKNFVVQGACPACKRQFVGYKTQTVRCTSCGNVVWQPQGGGGGDIFSRGKGRGGNSGSSKKSDPDIIDVEFEER
ncbi:uncharacterized protein LOC124931110 [Impatiens glandulifera]|uniref:uncharacterized protein LOC124931110 n=1 Tax=Impatiens glandulifera TaxID=253017 RepID=UPI001FB11974|nr:uncharacterized protein LOC124931110 [Impatiens glandulifera]